MKTIKTSLSSLFALLAICMLPTVAKAQEGELLATIHTTLYESDGESNSFEIVFGATEAGQYLDIDCGFGSEEVEVSIATLDDEGILGGSSYSGKVSKDGVIKIYGDPSKIDYINASGMEITDIVFNDKLSLQILNLEHNSIKQLKIDNMKNLQVLYIEDNPYSKETPLMIGKLPNLLILEMANSEWVSEDFTLKNFPALMSFDAYHSTRLKKCETSECPNLVRLSVEMTQVSELDLSNNPYLQVLNINESRVKSVDLSKTPKLAELYISHVGALNRDIQCEMPDLTKCPKLEVFFAPGNGFTSVDLTKNPLLYGLSLQKNSLTSLDLSKNTALTSVNLSQNYMDFATLPFERDEFSEYYYDEYDLPVNKSYKVGDKIDLSKRVLREGTTTGAQMYYTEKDAPTTFIALSDDYYSYNNGVITLKKAISKDVFCTFTNNKFEQYPLYTTRFTVKTAAEFNQPVKAIEISPIVSEGADIAFTVGIEGASSTNPKSIYVDYGNGEQYTVKVTEEIPSSANVKGKRNGSGRVKVYTEMDDEVTAFVTDGIQYNEIDVTDLTELQLLEIKNAGIYSIDLGYNAKLEKLDLSGNNLSKISLKGQTGYFYKSMLSDINLSNNKLDSIIVDDMYAVKKFNISHNNITEFSFANCDSIQYVDASYNNLEVVLFTHSEVAKHINVSNNKIYEIYTPEEAQLEYLNVSNNEFTLSTIPAYSNLTESQYIYAPQNNLQVALSSPGVDLSEYYTLGNNTTTYVWKKASDNSVLTLNKDYTDNKGSFKFLSPIFGQQVYCEMTNATYPQFAGNNTYKTTAVKAIDMPSIEIASFTTPVGDEEVTLSLASTEDGASVYIDWKGDGNVTQYPLKTTYTIFSAKTKKNAKVRVLISDEKEQVNIFSVSNATMSDLNLEGLKKAFAISITNAGLTEFPLSKSNSLGELNLSGNELSSIDLSRYQNLVYLSLSGNKFTSVDLSPVQGLQLAYLGNNAITEVKYNNPNLWNLDLGMNKLTTVSFNGASNIEQLWLNANQLTDVSEVLKLKKLKVLNVVANKLTFATLPYNQNWNSYSYGRQADIAIEMNGSSIDLSSQAMVGDSATTFRWFIDKPTYNEDEGVYEGEELIIDEEYTIKNGVTTFNFENKIDDIVCLMNNGALPNLDLFTTMVTYYPVAINEIIANNPNAKVGIYNAKGAYVGDDVNALSAGLYIVNINGAPYKLFVK